MILVTGGLGMIGAHTARALVDRGRDVVVTAHGRTEVPTFLDGRVVVEPLDVTDRDAFLDLGQRYAISDVVHLAGSVPGADPVPFFRTDTAGLLNAIEAARQWQVGRFAVASSLGSYLGRTEVPWHEEMTLPTTAAPHAIIAFKRAVEPIAAHALRGTGVHPLILRIGSTWGPLMDPESPFNPIPPYVSALLRGETPLALDPDAGGDLCYAPDTGRAIALLMTADTLSHNTYNVSSGVPYTNRQLVAAARAAIPGAAADLQEPSSGSSANPYLDIRRLVATTGFAPSYDLTAAVADYVSWRADHAR